jgi:DNA-binding response OmpR family regulator
VLFGRFSPVLRLGLESVLAERGYRVILDGDRRAREEGDGDVAAVLLDLDSPGCLEEARRLLERDPGLRVIGCSARRSEMTVFSAAGTGEPQPLDPALLEAAIEP